MFYESITSQLRVCYVSYHSLYILKYISRDFDFLYAPRPIGT